MESDLQKAHDSLLGAANSWIEAIELLRQSFSSDPEKLAGLDQLLEESKQLRQGVIELGSRQL